MFPLTINPLSYWCQACIDAQLYTYAASYLNEHEILEINPAVTGLTPLEYLEYFYYAGIMYEKLPGTLHSIRDSFSKFTLSSAWVTCSRVGAAI